MTLTTQSFILIEILDNDTNLYQEWDAALEKKIYLVKCWHYGSHPSMRHLS